MNATNFHFNPQTGETGPCRATEHGRGCPFSGLLDEMGYGGTVNHFGSPEAAREAGLAFIKKTSANPLEGISKESRPEDIDKFIEDSIEEYKTNLQIKNDHIQNNLNRPWLYDLDRIAEAIDVDNLPTEEELEEMVENDEYTKHSLKELIDSQSGLGLRVFSNSDGIDAIAVEVGTPHFDVYSSYVDQEIIEASNYRSMDRALNYAGIEAHYEKGEFVLDPEALTENQAEVVRGLLETIREDVVLDSADHAELRDAAYTEMAETYVEKMKDENENYGTSPEDHTVEQLVDRQRYNNSVGDFR